MIASYPSIYTLGHRYLSDLFAGTVVIQEKIDGSQFSFGIIEGQLHCRSKGQQIILDDPGMFAAAVASAKRCFDSGHLVEGNIYRCEYLSRPKHNALAYSRVPRNNLVLFDVCARGENYSSPAAIATWANCLRLEPVPILYEGEVGHMSANYTYLERESVLGGCKIEGVVVKNYNRFGIDKKILVGKFVSPAFKEVHRHEWRKSNPTQSDIMQSIIVDYKTSPRWYKAIQHLRELNILVDAPQDIGALIQEIQADVKREEIEVIKDRLFQHFWPQISRGIIDGFPEFYKQKLAENQTGAWGFKYGEEYPKS